MGHQDWGQDTCLKPLRDTFLEGNTDRFVMLVNHKKKISKPIQNKFVDKTYQRYLSKNHFQHTIPFSPSSRKDKLNLGIWKECIILDVCFFLHWQILNFKIIFQINAINPSELMENKTNRAGYWGIFWYFLLLS